MEIGNLNQRITILEHRTVVDEIGNHITKWEETFSLWAKVTVKTATETADAGVPLQTFRRKNRQQQLRQQAAWAVCIKENRERTSLTILSHTESRNMGFTCVPAFLWKNNRRQRKSSAGGCLQYFRVVMVY